MPTAYGAEFRQDVIYVARKGEAPLAQIAKDFGLSAMTLNRWIAIVECKESGAGPAASESAEMRELKKRNRSLEQENEIFGEFQRALGTQQYEQMKPRRRLPRSILCRGRGRGNGGPGHPAQVSS